jgi:hypothetical protein
MFDIIRDRPPQIAAGGRWPANVFMPGRTTMKTGFQRFQQTVQRQQQQRQRQLQGGFWLMKKRERESPQQQATQAGPISSSTYAPSMTPITAHDVENPIVSLIKLPFHILSFVIKAVVTLAVAGLVLFVAVSVLAALLS